MPQFHESYTIPETFKNSRRKPDFENLARVLDRKKPYRPTLFEFFLNGTLHRLLADENFSPVQDVETPLRQKISAFLNAGYDYVTHPTPGFGFPRERKDREGAHSISLNDGVMFNDRESFQNYPWPDPDRADYAFLTRMASLLPEGMKLIVHGPGGVLENVIWLTGYDNLCYIIADDPVLADDIFDAVGSRFVRYYEQCSSREGVGAVISNDDWGFNTQTLLSVRDMRRYVIPWHKKIVRAIHEAGRPAILHSCGNLDDVMDDIVVEIGYDGKHSYEDKIIPVEKAYERFSRQIAILGGIDVDFLCRSTPEDIFNRSDAIMTRSLNENGSYALGSGNSIPEYVPVAHYLAMAAAVRFS